MVNFLPLICGGLTALCLPRPGLCFLGWVSLAPLFGLWARALSGPRAFFSGLAAGFAFHGAALYWIYDTCRFAGLSRPIALLAWACLAATLGANWGLVAAAGRWLASGRPRFLRPWIWAAVWTAVAFVSERWTPRLNADLLEYTQWRYLSLLQVASLAGPHALGFALAAFNAVLWEIWEDGRAWRRASGPNLALILLAVSGIWLYGEYELAARASRPAPLRTARVELLQPAIDQYRKWDARFAREIVENFEELLARPRQKRPDLISWPESALPDMVGQSGDIPTASGWGKKLSAWQLVGAVSRDGERLHSSALLLDPSGKIAGAYHKRQLVPFGEFVPLPWLKRFIGILNELGNVTPGQDRQPLMRTPLGPAAAGICYEALFPRWARLDAERGARVIVNVTNDGWYKDTWGPGQHFQANVFRAIENRTTVIRSGNTGISGVIDPWGAVVARLELGAHGRLDADLALDARFPRGSLYSRRGDWFAGLCLLAVLALAAARAAVPRIL